MSNTNISIEYHNEVGAVSIFGDGVYLVDLTNDEITKIYKEIKKTRKKAKKNVETKTLSQTLVPVKFKKIKEGKRYRITETSGSIYEFVADHDAEDNDGTNWFVEGNADDLRFYSQDVESVYLIETSEIS